MLPLELLYEGLVVLAALLELSIFDFIVGDFELELVGVGRVLLFEVADVGSEVVYFAGFQGQLLLEDDHDFLDVLLVDIVVTVSLFMFGCLLDHVLVLAGCHEAEAHGLLVARRHSTVVI